jgi:hypothetical protein
MSSNVNRVFGMREMLYAGCSKAHRKPLDKHSLQPDFKDQSEHSG